MRRMATLVCLAALLAACTASPQVSGPAPAAPVAAPEAVPAFDPTPMRVEPDLRVMTAKSTNLYTGPGTFYLLVRELPAGVAVRYLSNSQGWLKVQTTEGETGWLPVADAAVADGRGQDVSYAMASGRWQFRLAAGPSVEVRRMGTGVARITVEGLTAPAEVVADGNDVVAIRTALPADLKAAGDIGDSGVGRVSLSEHGVLIDLEGQPLHQVVENGGGRVVLDVRPGVTGLEAAGAEGWRITYRGDLRPVLRLEGADLVLDLPGAMLAPGTKGAGDLQEVTPTPPSQAGGLRLRVPAPKGPYALYRPGPGRLDLRILPATLSGKTVVIDPGHGGEETGAVGPAGHIEKDINLAVSLRLKAILEQSGARVLMTRTADDRVLPRERWAEATSAVERTQLDLAARSAISNQAGADLYVSIHSNGGVPGDGGTEVYYANNNLNASQSRRLAELAQAELLKGLGLADRGVKQRPFNVIRMSYAPAILVEMGFMTEPSEERLLASEAGQQAAAEAVARAIRRYCTEPAP